MVKDIPAEHAGAVLHVKVIRSYCPKRCRYSSEERKALTISD
jgi:hypothetical protein